MAKRIKKATAIKVLAFILMALAAALGRDLTARNATSIAETVVDVAAPAAPHVGLTLTDGDAGE